MKALRHPKFESLWSGSFRCCGVFFKEEFDSLFRQWSDKLSAWQPRKWHLANGEESDALGLSSTWLEAWEHIMWSRALWNEVSRLLSSIHIPMLQVHYIPQISFWPPDLLSETGCADLDADGDLWLAWGQKNWQFTPAPHPPRWL